MKTGEKIGVAVVGLGRVGKTHLDAIRLNPNMAYIAAVIDVEESLARPVAKTFDTKFYLSLDEALNDSSIQAVVVCLPHFLHKPIACQIMETGRHVLVEKPWATNLNDGKEMIDKGNENGVVLMASQSVRFHWAFREAKKRIAAGEIGPPFNLLYMTALSINEVRGPSWWQDVNKTGGGNFTMSGSHSVDYTLSVYEGRKPIRVYSESRSIGEQLGGADEIIITIRFDDDSMATNYLSMNTKPIKREVFIVGPKGTINIVPRSSHIAGNLVGVFSAELFINGESIGSDSSEFHQFAVQMREFLEAISHKREPIVKQSEMLAQLSILDAAKNSAETHQVVFLQ